MDAVQLVIDGILMIAAISVQRKQWFPAKFQIFSPYFMKLMQKMRVIKSSFRERRLIKLEHMNLFIIHQRRKSSPY